MEQTELSTSINTTIRRCVEVFQRLSEVIGALEQRLHLRDEVLSCERILQLLKVRDDAERKKFRGDNIRKSLNRLMDILDNVNSKLQKTQKEKWPFTMEEIARFDSDLKCEKAKLETASRPSFRHVHPEIKLSRADETPLPFLALTERLKHLPREGWKRFIDRPESVASHSFQLALLGLFAPNGLDRMKCMLIGLCHDLGEAVVGDIPTYAGVPKERKHLLESLAFEYLENLVAPCNMVVADLIKSAWLDYELGTSPEARWVKQMDKLECLIQAHCYEQKTIGKQPGLAEFQGLVERIECPQAKPWLEVLGQWRSAYLSKRKHQIPIIFVVSSPRIVGKIDYSALSRELGYCYISLEDVLTKNARDQTFHHAELLSTWLRKKADVPVGLIVDLLAHELDQTPQDNISSYVVDGFPCNLDHFTKFETKMKNENYALFLTESTEMIDPQKEVALGESGDYQQLPYAGLKKRLSSSGKYVQILGSGSDDHFKSASTEFTKHAHRNN